MSSQLSLVYFTNKLWVDETFVLPRFLIFLIYKTLDDITILRKLPLI